ncbi:NrdJb [Oleiphilus sp. HI0009]|nr:NrdJb [Oleiphilus sp. HI0009]KZX83309.1 NrdJb [Oleiphilus sp. HI0009]
MTITIEKKIVAQTVVDSKEKPELSAVENTNIVTMNEAIARTEQLEGTTYKIKPAVVESALYITINDMVLNQGTENEERRPYEIFINSRDMSHFQWVIALTRLISGVFRKGGDVTFLIDELKSVYDPNGGYYKKGGVYMPSLVADIGATIETHMKSLGMIEENELGKQAREMVKGKIAKESDKQETKEDKSSFPDSATLCHKCHTKAVVIMDGCSTCLNCGDSKCS